MSEILLDSVVAKSGYPVYDLYGLRICSEIVLPAPLSSKTDLTQDTIVVQWEKTPAVSDCPPTGSVLAKLDLGNEHGYLLSRADTGYTLHFYRTCEFWICHDLRVVRVRLFPGVDPDMAAIFLVGNVMASILLLAGEYTLHASAVEIEGSALAFVGHSGMGKSTLAALLCSSGASFITDDVLRLRPNDSGFGCFRGTGEIRLRPGASALAEYHPGGGVRETSDGRIAVQFEHDPAIPSLSAIVIPLPSRHCHRIGLKRLSRSRALLSLMSYPRIQGLQEKEYIRGQFDFFALIASNVPVFEAEIPWGPPFSADIAPVLMGIIRSSVLAV